MTAGSDRKRLRLGVAQFDAIEGDIAANVAEHARLMDEAGGEGVHVLVFPELSITGYAGNILDEAPGRCRVDPDGLDLASLRDACRRNGLVAVVGAGLDHGRGLELSTIVYGRQGEVSATYGKRYLDPREKGWFVAGGPDRTIDVDGWRLGLGICYDSSFPEQARALALGGADAYLVSGAFPVGDSDHRRSVYFPARALENTVYEAFSNYVGDHGGLSYCGRSAVFGPDGRLLADAGPDRAGIATADLDPEKLRKTRENLTMLMDCRPG